jgi:hypothetical protein
MSDFVNTGELFDPNKSHPCVFGRISFIRPLNPDFITDMIIEARK